METNMDHLVAPKIKHKITENEDDEIKKYVKQYWEKNWVKKSHLMKNRSSRQIKERYYNYLCPTVKRTEWNDEEDEKLLNMVKEFGKKWRQIAKNFDGRTDVNLKNRYRLLERRERKYRTLLNEKNMKKHKKAKKDKKAIQKTPKNISNARVISNKLKEADIFDCFIEKFDEFSCFDDFILM